MKKTIFVLVVAMFAITCLAGCNKPPLEFNAQEFAAIQVDGLNGKGKINIILDTNYIETFCKNIEQERGLDKAVAAKTFLKTIKYSIPIGKTETLSNGDQLTIVAGYTEEAAKEANVKILEPKFIYTVSGLEDGQPLDPFANIQLLYDGISPNVSVKVKNRSENQFIRDITYTSEPSTKLSAGDKIIVTAKFDKTKAEMLGYILPDTLQKEIVVTNVDEYLNRFEDVDTQSKDKMKKEGTDKIESLFANKYSEIIKTLDLFAIGENKHKDAKFDTPELINIYIANLKQGEKLNIHNDIFYIYKVTARLPDEAEPRTTFAAISFKNTIKRGDGVVVVDYSTKQLVATDKDFNTVYNAIVTANKSSYEVKEITV